MLDLGDVVVVMGGVVVIEIAIVIAIMIDVLGVVVMVRFEVPVAERLRVPGIRVVDMFGGRDDRREDEARPEREDEQGAPEPPHDAAIMVVQPRARQFIDIPAGPTPPGRRRRRAWLADSLPCDLGAPRGITEASKNPPRTKRLACGARLERDLTVSILPSLSYSATRATIVGLAALLLLGTAAPARADGFISPWVGFNFGGDSGCPTISNCQDKKLNLGVGFGVLGGGFGFEEDVAFAQDFFGTVPGLDSSVLTVMSNLMVAPKIGPVRPYVLGGLGLVKTHVSLTPTSVFTSDNNNVGWDIGGGVMVFFGAHVGIRGDIRYIHAFQDLSIPVFTLNGTKLDFGRASGGVVLKF